MLCCQNCVQRIQNYFFEKFYGRNLFLNMFPDVEGKMFELLKTLYSQKCSYSLGKKSLDFLQKTSAGSPICILHIHKFVWWTCFWKCSKSVFVFWVWAVKNRTSNQFFLPFFKSALLVAWAFFRGIFLQRNCFSLRHFFRRGNKIFQTSEKGSQLECRSWLLPVQGKTFLESFPLNNFHFQFFFWNMGKKMSNFGWNFLIGPSKIRE